MFDYRHGDSKDIGLLESVLTKIRGDRLAC